MINLHLPLWKTGKILAFFGATGALMVQPLRPMVFVGDSMAPTYQTGEFVMTGPVGELERGDVVVIDMPDGPIVKRVAYLAGDEIPQIRVENRWRDLIEVKDPELKPNPKRYRNYRIPEGHVYVLGDNRPVSLDSREFGPVPLASVSRKVLNTRALRAE